MGRLADVQHLQGVRHQAVDQHRAAGVVPDRLVVDAEVRGGAGQPETDVGARMSMRDEFARQFQHRDGAERPVVNAVEL